MIDKSDTRALVVNDGYEMVPVGDLTVHPRNPKVGDLAAIGESIAVNGRPKRAAKAIIGEAP